MEGDCPAHRSAPWRHDPIPPVCAVERTVSATVRFAGPLSQDLCQQPVYLQTSNRDQRLRCVRSTAITERAGLAAPLRADRCITNFVERNARSG
jgi:hypothetical protein